MSMLRSSKIRKTYTNILSQNVSLRTVTMMGSTPSLGLPKVAEVDPLHMTRQPVRMAVDKQASKDHVTDCMGASVTKPGIQYSVPNEQRECCKETKRFEKKSMFAKSEWVLVGKQVRNKFLLSLCNLHQQCSNKQDVTFGQYQNPPPP